LYGCEAWSLTLREEQRPSVFANRVLRNICGSERDEKTGDWRKLQYEAFNDVFFDKNYSVNQVNKN